MDGDGFSTRGGLWIFDREVRAPWSGGSVPGVLSVRWPSVKLRATADRLTLSAPLIDPFVVTRGTVLSITPVDWAPAFSHGLRFEASDNHEATVFWTYRRGKNRADLPDPGIRLFADATAKYGGRTVIEQAADFCEFPSLELK